MTDWADGKEPPWVPSYTLRKYKGRRDGGFEIELDDGYTFRSVKEAVEWARQRYIQDTGWVLVPVMVQFGPTRCRRCGEGGWALRDRPDKTRPNVPITGENFPVRGKPCVLIG